MCYTSDRPDSISFSLKEIEFSFLLLRVRLIINRVSFDAVMGLEANWCCNAGFLLCSCCIDRLVSHFLCNIQTRVNRKTLLWLDSTNLLHMPMQKLV